MIDCSPARTCPSRSSRTTETSATTSPASAAAPRSPPAPATWSTALSNCSATCNDPRISCPCATASYLSSVKCLRFFERLAHRLVRERVHVLQLDHALGQQAQRPARPAVGRPGAGQGEETGFLLPVQLAPVEPRGRPGQQRRRQPLLHEPLPHPPDRAHAPPPRRRDRRIGPPRAAFGLVGLE